MSVVLASIAFWAHGHLDLIGDFGKTETINFKARFKRLKSSEQRSLAERLAASSINDVELLDLVLLDWELKSATGELIAYTPAMRAEVFEEWAGLQGQFVRAYFEALNGKGAAEKNSEAPSATTSEPTAPTATS